ncbi:hypothetical protein VYU27_009634, partial [Nannochloropsis oceanica]
MGPSRTVGARLSSRWRFHHLLLLLLPSLHAFVASPAPSSSSSPAFSSAVKSTHRDINPHAGLSPATVLDSLVFSSPSPTFDAFAAFIQEMQKDIITTLEDEDGTGATFQVDKWTRDGGLSHGATCVLEGGAFIEKGAVSVSIIKGVLSKERAAAMSSRGRDLGGNTEGGVQYAAAALSLVLHSANPHLPTFRSDVRYFECQGRGWFGGGADLTPYYLHDGDIAAFHALYRGLCDAFDPTK